ncbi:GNAT family N-acetyltransferase [Paenibacillus sp. HN-1]|uniref:GNAT family N-acetyltransferase n=1 Tax=Paenibacillus TaxID=44249 RepID=UPI001CA88C9A|nr:MULTISPECIES: GNAT family N-acetyltransferase [Paenibacillus]MBY9077174.1 GNAT family N-acetyltransferase [Paenibacillus sp. CGMCC 1.18879]MBY9083221.1 GNAT family N-acetyltransferase [Paenibacillus sinensis]
MEIRQLRAEEFDASVSLSEYAFQYKMSSESREKAKARYKPERDWGIFEEGELAAKFTLLPLETYIQGSSVLMGGIAGVATWPENRRKGLVARLLRHALEQMNKEGRPLSFLHPFSVPFYRKFGWDLYCEYKNYTIPTSKFPAKVQTKGNVVRDKGGVELLDSLYRSFASSYNGTLVRNMDWWEHSVLDDSTHYAVYYTEAGEPEGYALYKITNKVLTIDEFVWLSLEARKGLWTFFGNHDSMITEANLKLVPSDDDLPYLLPDPRIPQENYPYFMARIVNAKSLVEKLAFRADGAESSILLSLSDPLAPWNEGSWRLTISESGQASLEPSEAGDAGHMAACGIGTLTAMLLGYKRPIDLYRGGLLEGTEGAAVWLENKVLPARTALFDFF